MARSFVSTARSNWGSNGFADVGPPVGPMALDPPWDLHRSGRVPHRDSRAACSQTKMNRHQANNEPQNQSNGGPGACFEESLHDTEAENRGGGEGIHDRIIHCQTSETEGRRRDSKRREQEQEQRYPRRVGSLWSDLGEGRHSHPRGWVPKGCRTRVSGCKPDGWVLKKSIGFTGRRSS